MPSTTTLAAFAVAAYVLIVIPGPAVTFVVARSVEGGRAVGIASVLGVHTGSLVWVAASATGLAALLMSSVAAFTVVKYLGAAYLIYLGVRALLAAHGKRGSAAADVEPLPENVPALSTRRAFRQGWAHT